MALTSYANISSEIRRRKLEQQRIARENASTGCVCTCLGPAIIALAVGALSITLFFTTGSFFTFILLGIALAVFTVGLVALCIKYGDIHKPRPGQYIIAPDGRRLRVATPDSADITSGSGPCVSPEQAHVLIDPAQYMDRNYHTLQPSTSRTVTHQPSPSAVNTVPSHHRSAHQNHSPSRSSTELQAPASAVPPSVMLSLYQDQAQQIQHYPRIGTDQPSPSGGNTVPSHHRSARQNHSPSRSSTELQAQQIQHYPRTVTHHPAPSGGNTVPSHHCSARQNHSPSRSSTELQAPASGVPPSVMLSLYQDQAQQIQHYPRYQDPNSYRGTPSTNFLGPSGYGRRTPSPTHHGPRVAGRRGAHSPTHVGTRTTGRRSPSPSPSSPDMPFNPRLDPDRRRGHERGRSYSPHSDTEIDHHPRHRGSTPDIVIHHALPSDTPRSSSQPSLSEVAAAGRREPSMSAPPPSYESIMPPSYEKAITQLGSIV